MNPFLSGSSTLSATGTAGIWALTFLVMLGAVPLLVSTYQSLLIGLHRFRNHYAAATPYLPRVAILVPAWNEAAVIGRSVDRLMSLDYPPDRLRVYVVDDASTDRTPEVLQEKEVEYDHRVIHLRRAKGGEGKAHTLNHGLALIMAEPWMEALLIMDADVISERDSLRKMARHLGDPRVGAVTAYIKEGSDPANYLQRFVAFEYVTAQAAARRSQNVLGAMACLAGGAQLHSRANLEALGGRIDTTSLAEDTFTTFNTQLSGSRVVFDGNATVWAEEPDQVVGLWKQRLRWARGNVQVTSRYRHVWFRPSRDHRLGSISFGLVWFSLFLLPVLMILSSASLVALYFIADGHAYETFRLLWVVNSIAYLFVTAFALCIDPETARKSWLQGILFPGIVSTILIVYGCAPAPFTYLAHRLFEQLGIPLHGTVHVGFMLFAYSWVALCMPVAYLGKKLEEHGHRALSPLFVYVGGYGPLLCAVTFASYVLEARGAEMKWDKTEKTGKVRSSR
jgi:cellulose synthase/poly-beta-1,6-N-acetylglucosamine synthase-like glycosyltransferase